MLMKKKKKRSSKAFWVSLLIYGIVLSGLSAFGIKVLIEYSKEYEASQATPILERYIEDLHEKSLNGAMERTIAEMPHELQSDEEAAAVIPELLQGDIDYVRKGSSDGGKVVTYSLKSGSKEFGAVTLARDESYADKIHFGLLPWKIQGEEFDFTGLYSSIEATVPGNFSVSFNGRELGKEYIVETRLPYDALESFYSECPNLPTMVRYQFDHVIGTLEPELRDENGNVFAFDPEKGDAQFLPVCAGNELAELEEYNRNFMSAYLVYTSGAYDDDTTYQNLVPYMEQGSDIYTRMTDWLPERYWCHTSSITIHSITLNEALSLGNGYYLLNTTSDATTYTEGIGEERTISTSRAVVYRSDEGFKAISLILD